jgi:hypothetical protein
VAIWVGDLHTGDDLLVEQGAVFVDEAQGSLDDVNLVDGHQLCVVAGVAEAAV